MSKEELSEKEEGYKKRRSIV